jgi:phosphoenolpyruvate carboxylase
MYQEWPFFKATIDLVEMILAKCDERIAALYDEVLVTSPEEKQLGIELREKLSSTVRVSLSVHNH